MLSQLAKNVTLRWSSHHSDCSKRVCKSGNDQMALSQNYSNFKELWHSK